MIKFIPPHVDLTPDNDMSCMKNGDRGSVEQSGLNDQLKVCGSNPISASRLLLSRLGQPGSIPALVPPSAA
ncbi:hypothetical protein T265_10813 [Opisthorchis viverrini]|uniref:Uncharacterized protein n=1 Tax=Opisthorchis viverrini TaxID=6198 RepID=A0A074Z5A6_OPIVI|nr:hypothetical protein T265_10813 [Opisthorchis viverrini]KER20702.1 hypothetical protein T265_10813 [Opisthorchis viverrini]